LYFDQIEQAVQRIEMKQGVWLCEESEPVQMDVFEAKLDEIVNDGPQLINEALQLENFIFSTQPCTETDVDSQLSDWALRFCTIRSVDDKN